ncbi:helix-turn-helix domain-containing protein [Psychromicrobium lacuslunae]|uniref:helix-turn-helix domain-containing protein n=1 Tax=Psychromicrobium lacuslunae TaxID=1618207 RepID=UPI0009E5E8D5|nr:helix-turn-helix transcriptional regulator [Psychromicrobium lacuslunae]
MSEPLLREVHGLLLRRARLRQGKKLEEVAAAAGISMQYLSEIERGRKEPSSEILAAVCRGLGSNVSMLTKAAHRQYLQYLQLRIIDGENTGESTELHGLQSASQQTQITTLLLAA